MLSNVWVSLEGKRDGEKYKLLCINFEENLYSVYKNKNKMYNCYPRQLNSSLGLSFNGSEDSVYVNNLIVSEGIDLSKNLDKGYAYKLTVKDINKDIEYYVLCLDLNKGVITYNLEPYNKDVYDREDYFEYSQTEEGIKAIERYKNNTFINDIETLKLDNNLELNLYIRFEEKYTMLEESEMWVNNIVLN